MLTAPPLRLSLPCCSAPPRVVRDTHAQSPPETADDPGCKHTLPVGLLVGCSPPDVSPWLLSAVSEANLVFDGRLVVDANFATTDPRIFAGGTVAKFSRRFGPDLLHELYNSTEIGFALGDAVTAALRDSFEQQPSSSSAPAGRGGQEPQVPPHLSGARVVGCVLPSDHSFMFAGCARAFLSPSVEPPAGGRAISTCTPECGYMQLNLDAGGVVHSALYLGQHALQVHRLASLIGLSSTYLSPIIKRADDNSLADLVSALSEPWAELLFHEGFAALRGDLVAGNLAAVARGVANADIATAVQDATLEFMRAHHAELTSYNLDVLTGGAAGAGA